MKPLLLIFRLVVSIALLIIMLMNPLEARPVGCNSYSLPEKYHGRCVGTPGAVQRKVSP